MSWQIEGDHPVLLIELACHLMLEYLLTGRIAVDEKDHGIALSIFFVC
jgi:hypothetical protein